MPNPTKNDVHINSALTNISVAYIQDESSFISGRVFPMIPVKKQSDRYFVYSKADWFRDDAEKRVRGTESAGGGYNIDNTPNYFCETYAYHQDVTAEDRANSDSPLAPDEDATQFVTQKLLLKREIDWAARFFGGGVWTYDYDGASSTSSGSDEYKYWSSTDSDPIGDIGNEQVSIQSVTGKKPNILVLGPYVYQELRNHADILDRIKYTERGIVTTDLLASLFDVDKVLVANAVKNSAEEGATESTDFIMGKNALLAYAPNSAGIKKPSAGYVFTWTGLEGSGRYGNRIAKLNMNWLGLGTTRIEGEMSFDTHLVSADLGAFFEGIVE